MNDVQLPADAERGLTRFTQRLERLDIDQLRIYALRPPDRMSHQRAMERAEVLAFKSGRDKVLEAARATVQEWLIRVFNEHQYKPTMFGLNWGRSLGTADDRAEIARTLREAVTALIVWDLAADRDRAELLGAWGGLAT